jgi:hypothetical protein
MEIRVESLDGGFLTATADVEEGGGIPWMTIVIVLIIAAAVFIVVLGARKAKESKDAALKERIAATEKALAEDKTKAAEAEKGFREYVVTEGIEPDKEGKYYDRRYGDYISPAIWAAVLMNQRGMTGAEETRRHNCACVACACVSCACACACACAGGGAAGCSRKTLHECRSCPEIKKENCAVSR